MYDKYDTKELITDRLTLRKGTSSDCINVYEYNMFKCRGACGKEIIEKDIDPVDYIGDNAVLYYEECAKNKIFDWYMFLDNIAIGNILADRENSSENSIELSFNMRPDHWRKGYMKEGVSCVISYLFSLGYSKIICSFDSGNVKALSFLFNLGFSFSNIIHGAYIKNGVPIDTFVMTMTKDSWVM